MNVIPTSSRIGIALIPPRLSDGLLNESDIQCLDMFSDLNELSGILSDEDVAYYLWYNSRISDFMPGFSASDFVCVINDPRISSWVLEHQTVYDRVAKESEAKYSIAAGGSRRALAVDYGGGCYYAPILSSGVLYLVGTESDPYEGNAGHFYDAVLAQLSKVVRVSDLAQYDVFDKFVMAEQA